MHLDDSGHAELSGDPVQPASSSSSNSATMSSTASAPMMRAS